MFDLFRSRAKAVRYLLGGLLMLVALSMVITLVPGFGSGSSGADDQIIAEVGKDAITVRQVQNELQALVRGRQVPPEMLQVYAPQFIEQMIVERAVAYQAGRMGFDVPDTELAATIRQILPSLFNNGQLIDKAAYEAFLAERGMSIPEFEANVRKQIMVSRLRNLATEGAVATPQEVQQEFEKANRKAKVEYVSFKPDSLKSAVNITPAELQAYYETNKANYTEPEKRDLALLIADQEKVGASVELSDAQLRQAYNSQIEQFRTAERVKVRHILLKTMDKPAAEVEKIKQRAEDLLKQVKSGADFGELAKKNSEDTVSAEKNGDLGWVVRGQTVPNFEKAAFSLPLNKVSDLITTEYGFHILQVQEKQAAHTQSFDEVKGQLGTEFKKQIVFERMQTGIEQARAALEKSPGSLEQVAAQYSLDLVRAEKMAATQALPKIDVVPDLGAALAGLKNGEVTPVFQAQGDRLVIAQVLNVYPATVPPLTEVESKVREVLTRQKADQLANERATQAIARIKAGEDIQKVAKELGGEVKTSNDFTINEAIEGVGSGTIFAEAFTKPVGTILGPSPAANQTVVARVLSHTPADLSKLPAERANLVQQIKQKKSQERRELFYDSILAQLIKEGKVKKHNTTITRLVNGYRG